MHYALLFIALELAREDIYIMKKDDMHEIIAPKIVKKNDTLSPDISIDMDMNMKMEEELNSLENNNLPNEVKVNKDGTLTNNSLLPKKEDITNISNIYTENEEFADLLPEDELGNIIIQDKEEQGPKFIQTIKEKLIEITEKKVADKKEQKKIETENKDIKKDVVNIVEEELSPKKDDKDVKENDKEENLLDILSKNDAKKNIIEEKKEDATIKDAKTKIDDKKKGITEVIKSKVEDIKNLVIKKEKKVDEELKEIKLPKNVNSPESREKSEIKYGILDEPLIQKKELLNKQKYDENDYFEYDEEENYQKFLNEKEIKILVSPELLKIPNVKPRKKEIVSYDVKKIPDQLLTERSHDNRHIPKITMESDREKMAMKIIEYGMLAEFIALLREFGDNNLIMKNQYSLLTYATKYKQYSIMEYLIHVGANINQRDNRLETPLLMAVENNDLKAVEILVKAKANLNMIDIFRRTPLIYAIEKDYELIALYLIDNGADVNIKNATGEGTLSISLRLGRNRIRERIIKILNEKKAKET